jgi:hypothetical protein
MCDLVISFFDIDTEQDYLLLSEETYIKRAELARMNFLPRFEIQRCNDIENRQK